MVYFDPAQSPIGLTAVPVCRTCGTAQVRLVGQLPDSQQFAGHEVDFVLPGGQLWRCRVCSLLFRDPLLAQSTYDQLYRTGNLDVWDSEDRREDFRLMRHALRNLDGQRLKVLDFGCYTGQLLSSLPKSFKLFGIEPNVKAAKVATDRGIDVANSLEDLEDSIEEFDVILVCDVLEHVPNPLSLLQQLRGRLNSGGMLLFSTGNSDAWLWRLTGSRFWYCRFPEHISFIGESWLERMPARAQLELESVQTFNHLGGGLEFTRLLAAVLFWFSPVIYQMFRRALSKKGPLVGAPGNGATKDHLLCVCRAV